MVLCHPALEVRVATWVLLIGEKMVAPDENHFEPPGGVAGELWPIKWPTLLPFVS